MADMSKHSSGTDPVATKSVTSTPAARLLRDDSLQDLRTHLNQWWEDRVNGTVSGNLNDHNYLMGMVKDMAQDTGELFNITLGILDRLIESTDAQPIQSTKPKGGSK